MAILMEEVMDSATKHTLITVLKVFAAIITLPIWLPLLVIALLLPPVWIYLAVKWGIKEGLKAAGVCMCGCKAHIQG